jgi:hypothetical protein
MTASRGALHAGAAKVDITPQDLSGLTNLWRTPFVGVHDPIFVRALVLENGVNRAAIVAADLVEFGDTNELRQRIEKEIGIPVENTIITASHNHNAPRVGSVTPGATAQKGGPATVSYTKWVNDKIIDALREALAALQPARAGCGKGQADLNTNRNLQTAQGWEMGSNPEGPSDKSLWVVKVEALDGKPLALLINYAVHSVFIGPENQLVTGDLAGAVERFLEGAYQDEIVALWTIGPAGDQNPKSMDHGPDHKDDFAYYGLMASLAQGLGEDVLSITKGIHHMDSEVRLEAGERVISLPARIPPRDANRPGMEVKPVEALDLRLGMIVINQIALTWVSGEVVTKIYWHLLKESPLTATILITMANDRVGYIVDDAGYDTPTFESTASPFLPGFAERAIVNNLVDMISDLDQGLD